MNEPEPRTIATSQDAEVAARDWLRWMGHTDAEIGPRGADGGIDVESAQIVAQVKAHVRPTGRPVVQQTYGAAIAKGKSAVVFSLGGFTSEAAGFADDVRVGLFTFDYSGHPEPQNPTAHELFSSAGLAEQMIRLRCEPLWGSQWELIGILPRWVSDELGRDRLDDGPVAWRLGEDRGQVTLRFGHMFLSGGSRQLLTGLKTIRTSARPMTIVGKPLSSEGGGFPDDTDYRHDYYRFVKPESIHIGRRFVSGALSVTVMGYQAGTFPVERFYGQPIGGVKVDLNVSGRLPRAYAVIPASRLRRRRVLADLEQKYPLKSSHLVSCDKVALGPKPSIVLHGLRFGISPMEQTTLVGDDPEAAMSVLAFLLGHQLLGLRNFDIDLLSGADPPKIMTKGSL